jgi:hypothetical protein
LQQVLIQRGHQELGHAKSFGAARLNFVQQFIG